MILNIYRPSLLAVRLIMYIYAITLNNVYLLIMYSCVYTMALQCVSFIANVDCMTGNSYGFTGTRACVLLYIAKVNQRNILKLRLIKKVLSLFSIKVFEWTPNSLEPFIPGIRFGSHLPVSCSVEEAHSSLVSVCNYIWSVAFLILSRELS